MTKRFVFDTNTIISAALFKRSIPRQALDHAQEAGVLLVSEATTNELITVLLRDKFDKYIDRDTRAEFLASFLQRTVLVDIVAQIQASRDKQDDMFLDVAVNGNAEAIISGDDDLLTLHPFQEIRIITPRTFLDEQTETTN
jgi:hypothetical protein